MIIEGLLAEADNGAGLIDQNIGENFWACMASPISSEPDLILAARSFDLDEEAPYPVQRSVAMHQGYFRVQETLKQREETNIGIHSP
jgi:hypothetical protein